MRKIDQDRFRRSIPIHGFVGGMIASLTVLFIYFIVLGLGDAQRFMKFTASQHPIELPIYLILCGIGASLIYFGVVWLVVRKRKMEKTVQD